MAVCADSGWQAVEGRETDCPFLITSEAKVTDVAYAGVLPDSGRACAGRSHAVVQSVNRERRFRQDDDELRLQVASSSFFGWQSDRIERLSRSALRRCSVASTYVRGGESLATPADEAEGRVARAESRPPRRRRAF